MPIATVSGQSLLDTLRQEADILKEQLSSKLLEAQDSCLRKVASRRPAPNPCQYSLKYTYEGHAARIWGIRLGSNNRYMASVAADECMILWDVYTGAKLDCVHISDWAQCIAMSPNCRLVSQGGLDNAVTVYSLYLSTPMRSRQTDIAVPNYDTILDAAASSGDWDRVPIAKLKGHGAYVSSVDFIDDVQILSGSADFTIRQWDVMHSKSIAEYRGHFGEVDTIRVSDVNPNLFLSSGSDGAAKIWDVRTGTHQTLTIGSPGSRSPTLYSRWFPGGDTYASATEDGWVHLLDMRCSNQVDRYRWDDDISTNPSPLHSRKASTSTAYDSSVRPTSGSDIFGMLNNPSVSSFSTIEAPTLTGMEFTLSGRCLVFSYSDGLLKQMDILQGQTIAFLKQAHPRRISGLAVGPGRVYTSGYDGVIKAWSCEERHEIRDSFNTGSSRSGREESIQMNGGGGGSSGGGGRIRGR